MRKKIKITADSTCDLSKELVAKYDITIIPLYVNMGSESYRDGVDIVPQDIFSYVDQTGNLPKTSAVTVDDYTDYFSRFTEQGFSVIHINISAEFSCCHQNAIVAAAQFDDIYVIDSRNLSTGSGLLVLKAAEMAEEGLEAIEICEELQRLIPKVEATFMIDRLNYLQKGGRCSMVAALGANLLQLKPRIDVADGKMLVGRKYRGKYVKCIEEYVAEKLKDRDDIDYQHIFITHSPCDSPEYVALAREVITLYGKFEEVLETDAGCTVSNHCGPNTLGVLFLRK